MSSGKVTARRAGFRWTIVALVFAATTINYLDRQVLGILAPTLQREFGWSDADYGAIVSWFSFAYAFGLLLMGRVLDYVGVRAGMAASIVLWSVAAIGHAFAGTVGGFSFARGALGLGEAGNFPGAVKAVAEWFPKRERALAIGIFNAGTNVGAFAAPLLVPWIAVTWGWREAFVITGLLGFVWLVAWMLVYRDAGVHPRVTPEELAYIRSDGAESTARTPWARLLGDRQAWAFVVGKALTDPVWFFYLFWLPKFLDANYGVKLTGLALPLIAIYFLADVGSVAGGWCSSAFLARGWSVNRARKTAMLIAALLIVPTALAPKAGGLWGAVALVTLAAAAHQWWSANLFCTVSDMYPRRAVASVVGIGGFTGSMSSTAVQRLIGRLLDGNDHDYTIVFAFCGFAYLLALGLFHLLAPRMQPVARLAEDG